MKTEKNNKRNFKEKSAGKQWAGKSEAKKYADKKKTEFKKNVTKKTEQKKYEQKKEEQKKTVGKSLCPVHGRCGGCQLLDIPYEEQLKQKQTQVTKLLKPYCPTEKIIGMEDPFHYRNKVHAVFGHKKDGTVISGIYQEGTHFIVPVDDCLIENQKADAIIRDIRGLLKSFKIKTYNEDTGYGLFRHVLIRTGYHSGQIMVVLVLGSPILPSKNNFVKALRKLHPEITTIVLNVNGQKTSMILGEKETVLYGKGYIEDELCGKTFRISSKSFYQVNPVQTEKLYGKAIELAGLTGKERVIDAYCGIGTIGLIASDKAREVISVELNQDAVRDAIVNAKRNSIKNVRFYHNDAGVFMRQMAEAGEHADVVFMDPPRSGSDEKFLSSVLTLKPEKIVYVSCEPTTLARDLKYLTKHGYKAVRAVPFDMFPATEHVETVVLLSQQKPDDTIEIDLDLDELDATSAELKATYQEIKDYVLKEFGLKVSSLYISQVKRKCGIEVGENYNLPKSENARVPQCPKEKEDAIKAALKYYAMI